MSTYLKVYVVRVGARPSCYYCALYFRDWAEMARGNNGDLPLPRTRRKNEDEEGRSSSSEEGGESPHLLLDNFPRGMGRADLAKCAEDAKMPSRPRAFLSRGPAPPALLESYNCEGGGPHSSPPYVVPGPPASAAAAYWLYAPGFAKTCGRKVLRMPRPASGGPSDLLGVSSLRIVGSPIPAGRQIVRAPAAASQFC